MLDELLEGLTELVGVLDLLQPEDAAIEELEEEVADDVAELALIEGHEVPALEEAAVVEVLLSFESTRLILWTLRVAVLGSSGLVVHAIGDQEV